MYDAYFGGHSENNIKCVVHDDLGQKNRTTRYILPRHWLYNDFLSFIVVEYIRFFHGALQLSSQRSSAGPAQLGVICGKWAG